MEKWWKSGGNGWPGGRRDGCILRFAEAGTDSAVGWSVWCSNTAEPARGWPYTIATRIPPGLSSINYYGGWAMGHGTWDIDPKS